MKILIAASMAALAIAAPAPLAFACDDWKGGFAVTRHEAISIAHAYGLYHLKEIERDDGEWEIEGCTADGREIDIEIHGRTGEVIALELDDDYDC